MFFDVLFVPLHKKNNILIQDIMRMNKGKGMSETPIQVDWTDIKFNGGFYKGFKITVYDYKKNNDVTVFVSTQSLEKQLQKYYFATETPAIKNIIARAKELYDKYSVFLPDTSFNRKTDPKTLKKLVEDNLYPSY